MTKNVWLRRCQAFGIGLFVLATLAVRSFAQGDRPGKILGGYFEEWIIYYAGSVLSQESWSP
jgi:hypothetical protein